MKAVICILCVIIPNIYSKSLVDLDQIKKDKADKGQKTIKDEYIAFFDLECLGTNPQAETNFVKQFSNCFNIDQKADHFKKTVDHWVVLKAKKRGGTGGRCPFTDKAELKQKYCVSNVHADQMGTATTTNDCKKRRVSSSFWNLNQMTPNIKNGFETIKYDKSFDPKLDVIVMDTGIDSKHKEFKGITYKRIYDEYKSISALHHHGSHVAGILLGRTYGVLAARKTKIRLFDVRVFDDKGKCGGLASFLNGYDAIITHLEDKKNKDRKFIVNLSIGSGNWAELDKRLKKIKDLGGIIFAAAGNQNTDAKNRSPASSPDTITVGNHDATNKRQTKSNYGTKVDIWGAGTNIISAKPGGGRLPDTGTSMATPLVAGIAANILANNPTLDFDGIKKKLLDNSVKDVNDGKGNTKLPRAQSTCTEYCGGSGAKCKAKGRKGKNRAMEGDYNRLYYEYYEMDDAMDEYYEMNDNDYEYTEFMDGYDFATAASHGDNRHHRENGQEQEEYLYDNNSQNYSLSIVLPAILIGLCLLSIIAFVCCIIGGGIGYGITKLTKNNYKTGNSDYSDVDYEPEV